MTYSRTRLAHPSEPAQENNKTIKFQEVINGKIVHFTLHRDTRPLPNFTSVTSVAVVPFVDGTTIVATHLKRGLDIPGGHVEPYDDDATATAIREAQEEAGVELALPLRLIGTIESDYEEAPTYMLVTAARVTKLMPYTPQLEALGREQVTLNEFLQRFTAGSAEMMQELCKRAQAVRHELF